MRRLAGWVWEHLLVLALAAYFASGAAAVWRTQVNVGKGGMLLELPGVRPCACGKDQVLHLETESEWFYTCRGCGRRTQVMPHHDGIDPTGDCFRANIRNSASCAK